MSYALQREGVGYSPPRVSTVLPTVAEYFAGIGLFRMGLEDAGWKVVYANDWNPEREQIYRGFFGHGYEVEDVFNVDPEHVPPVTLATCSFPCIDLSLAGNQGGLNGKHSSAFWGFYNILKNQGTGKPPMLLLENVVGWLSTNQGADFLAVAKALNKIGYACDAFTLDARCFVPQSRPRVFLLGISEVNLPDSRCKSADIFFPRSERLLPAKLKRLLLCNDDIRWLRLDIPEPPPYKSCGFSGEVVEDLPLDDPRWWSNEKVEKHLGMMSPSHLSIIKKLVPGHDKISRTFYRRCRENGQRAEVRSDDVAGCLRTAIGGSGKQFMVTAKNGKVRMRTLTAREYARLQGVPDAYRIAANTERQSLNAFGDAVCVPVVSWIARNILTPLAEELKLCCR
ncbi:MAG: DNA cytosine methyltransferase [Gammaproteobacteria bacterium]|nr:DNA cytosine methyltransferase [Gammaproteobacteria bacterium]MCY4210839.1 DNA cytosine methyltransferase [Gammaproteobacteria bacterium]MCY4281909.1 DNA cytosine methyltransferase [Gammaproteobacteria bacterium]MCY4339211.1 DNA cytosine methyltransferase [Gammaproteobacteria bacterium]